MKKELFFLSTLYAGCIVPAAAEAETAKALDNDVRNRPNVIIILADDLGYGDLQCYGAHIVRTPGVDRLAKSGIRFTNAHAVAAKPFGKTKTLPIPSRSTQLTS